MTTYDDRPVHQPIAPDAPIPGRNWYGGCEDTYPRVNEDGTCEGCGERACPICGKGFYPDGGCGCEKKNPVGKRDGDFVLRTYEDLKPGDEVHFDDSYPHVVTVVDAAAGVTFLRPGTGRSFTEQKGLVWRREPLA